MACFSSLIYPLRYSKNGLCLDQRFRRLECFKIRAQHELGLSSYVGCGHQAVLPRRHGIGASGACMCDVATLPVAAAAALSRWARRQPAIVSIHARRSPTPGHPTIVPRYYCYHCTAQAWPRLAAVSRWPCALLLYLALPFWVSLWPRCAVIMSALPALLTS